MYSFNMKYFFIIFLLLTVIAAKAGTVLLMGVGLPTSGGNNSPTIDANFAANTISGCASFAACLTTTRAQGEVCTDASGNLTSVAANTPCVTSAGLQAYGAATNLITQSNTFS